MRSRFPLLDQLRDERRRQEEEIVKPYRDELWLAARLADELRARQQKIESALATDIGRTTLEYMKEELARAVYQQIAEQAGKFGPGEPVRVMVNPMFSDIEEILQQMKHRLRVHLTLDVNPSDRVTYLRIDIDRLSIQRAMLEAMPKLRA